MPREDPTAQAGQAKRPSRARRKRVPRREVSTPKPVDGRVHIDVQTDNFLEEITVRPAEREFATQTDALLDRPSSPLFIPKPAGESRATWIEPGDLFDFDLEVKPILEVLVGKTIDQALVEVLEEQELAAITEQKQLFEQTRDANLVETRRLEAEEMRRFEEKERRMAQEKKRKKQKEDEEKRATARNVSKEMLSNLEDTVIGICREAGLFYDRVEREIEQKFMPWLVNQVVAQNNDRRASAHAVNSLVEAAITLQQEQADAAEAERRERTKREAEALARKEAEEAAAAAAEAERVRLEEEQKAREEDAESGENVDGGDEETADE